MKKLTVLVIILFYASGVWAQDKQAMRFAKTIQAKDLETRLAVLASDEMEGRETGTRGQKMAAAYIAGQFESFGLKAPVDDSYYQKFDLDQRGFNNIYLKVGEEKKEAFKDFLYYSSAETFGEEYVEIVIEGENIDYRDKLVAVAIEGMGGWNEKVESYLKKGARGAVIVITNDQEFSAVMSRFGPLLQREQLELPSEKLPSEKKEVPPAILFVNKEMLAWVFDSEFDKIMPTQSTRVILNADYLNKPIETENVLGYLEGSEKSEEVLIITSHYDHIGITNGEINNGADDDGSGTTTVLELAEAFTLAAEQGLRPRRSILFMTVAGEEKGLLGSQYYADRDPVFSLESTVANLNIDMVGRIDPKHEGNPEYVYLIGSDKLSKELHDLSESVNHTYTKLELDYTYNDENDPNRFYYRSDHYNFVKNNIPIIFYFNGTHADYHQPTDTIEKIDFEIMEQRAKLIFYTAWELANREERVKLD